MEEMMGAFYLHVNCSLIWKPAAVFLNTSPEEYFEGGMVVKWWTIPKKMPGATIEEAVSEFVLPMLRDMLESGAGEDEVARVALASFRIVRDVLDATIFTAR